MSHLRELAQLWDNLERCQIATDDEIRLITSINGYNEETLNDVLFCRTGYRDWEQYIDGEDNED